jgi:hypothetical protein
MLSLSLSAEIFSLPPSTIISPPDEEGQMGSEISDDDENRLSKEPHTRSCKTEDFQEKESLIIEGDPKVLTHF